MKKFLLMTAAVAALSFGANADISYMFVFRGKTSANADANFTFNAGKYEPMTSNGDGSYSCTVPTLNVGAGGFKIVSDDKDEMKKAAEMGVSSTSSWHTQFGAAPYSSGVVSLDEDASPFVMTTFCEELAATGHAPGEIQLSGGVQTATNVNVTFWPATKEIKVTGTPTAWKTFGITNSGTGWAAPTEANTFKHEGNGIYTLEEYDFGEEEGQKTFKIRPTGNTKPTYGFAEDDKAFSMEAPQVRAESNGITKVLTSTHIDSEKRREIGDGSKAASINVTLAHSVKANLTGKYSVVFNANTNELTLTPTADNPTAVAEIAADGNAPVEYYNMQGVRVENPENGIYVRRQGSKVSKVVVK